jgi:hypothetical protein
VMSLDSVYSVWDHVGLSDFGLWFVCESRT